MRQLKNGLKSIFPHYLMCVWESKCLFHHFFISRVCAWNVARYIRMLHAHQAFGLLLFDSVQWQILDEIPAVNNKMNSSNGKRKATTIKCIKWKRNIQCWSLLFLCVSKLVDHKMLSTQLRNEMCGMFIDFRSKGQMRIYHIIYCILGKKKNMRNCVRGITFGATLFLFTSSLADYVSILPRRKSIKWE